MAGRTWGIVLAVYLHSQRTMTRTSIFFRTLNVQGLTIAYREAGDPQKPKVVLLHGFPSSSHQYRDLIPALATDFHVIAPDYPGFGNSDMPDPATFAYTFDTISEMIEAFLKDRGFDHFGLFLQDYGGPVGFRIVTRNRGMLDWLIIQNTNAYEIGFTKAWDGFRGAYGRIEARRRKNRSQPFSKRMRSREIIFTARKIPSGSAPTTGSQISALCNAHMRDACNSISFTITAQTSTSTRNGRHF